MTVKLNFELDKRINSIDDIQTIICNDQGFIGCKGFFFDQFVQTKDLTKCKYGTLVDIDVNDSDDHCFKARDENGNDFVGYYRFFLPEVDLKPVEKTYKAFTIKEFIKKYPVGAVFKIRQKQKEKTETCVQYTGYKVYEQRIYLGITDFTFDELFENFEMSDQYQQDDTWIPFGVEE